MTGAVDHDALGEVFELWDKDVEELKKFDNIDIPDDSQEEINEVLVDSEEDINEEEDGNGNKEAQDE